MDRMDHLEKLFGLKGKAALITGGGTGDRQVRGGKPGRRGGGYCCREDYRKSWKETDMSITHKDEQWGFRPIDRFYSQLTTLENRRTAIGLGPEDRDYIVREFTRLIAPMLGAPAAGELCLRTLDRIAGREGAALPAAQPIAAPTLQRLGAIAAFLLGEYDDTVPLEAEDWDDIRETLEDVSGEMDLAALTTLMGELLSRGKLKS